MIRSIILCSWIVWTILFSTESIAAFRQVGTASTYCDRKVATGHRMNCHGLTAAHRTLPFGSRVRVTNPRNNRSVVVVINDRGPFRKRRIIDLSTAVNQLLGLRGLGTVIIQHENNS